MMKVLSDLERKWHYLLRMFLYYSFNNEFLSQTLEFVDVEKQLYIPKTCDTILILQIILGLFE